MASIDLRNPGAFSILLSDTALVSEFIKQEDAQDFFDQELEQVFQAHLHDAAPAIEDFWNQQSEELDSSIDYDELNPQIHLQDVVAPIEDLWNQVIDEEFVVDEIPEHPWLNVLEDVIHHFFDNYIVIDELVDEPIVQGIHLEEIVVDAGPDNDNWGNIEFDFTSDLYENEDANQPISFVSGPVPTFGTYHALAHLVLLEARLDVRLETDEGTVNALASDSGGTTVNFNKSYKDIISINVSVLDTVEKKAIFDFTDVPNPTSFKVLVFDTTGARVNATVHWISRGVL